MKAAPGAGPLGRGGEAELAVDARGLACPLPLVRAPQALMLVEPGERILVFATDPTAPRDFADYCEASGHRLIAQGVQAGVHLLLEKRQA